MYLSSATHEFSESELMALLEGSRKRNAKPGVTGLMLYSEGNIMHVIEGPTVVVQALFAKIRKDPRHRGIQLLWSKPIAKRDFPDYNMGFRRGTPGSIEKEVPALAEVMNGGEPSSGSLDKMSKQVGVLLKTFAKNTRLIE